MISKRELLDLTNISYGQLYRWKREMLIPEDWFIKQSVPSGQETFFPKDKILARINQIIDLKDKYSLEELSQILNPEINNRIFLLREIVSIEGIDLGILNDYLQGETTAKFTDIVLIFLFSRIKKQITIPNECLVEAMRQLKKAVNEKNLNLSEYVMDFIRQGEDYRFMVHKPDSIIDLNLSIEKTYVFESIINEIKEKGMN
ncbi:MAG TPA: DUF4004 family protein [Bacilli bacterium]|nr:DUF4004 family protein [Bacilli bacterium]